MPIRLQERKGGHCLDKTPLQIQTSPCIASSPYITFIYSLVAHWGLNLDFHGLYNFGALHRSNFIPGTKRRFPSWLSAPAANHPCANEGLNQERLILCANTDLTFFPALLRSLIKSLGSEHTWNHSFRTGRQMERNSSLFPLFCLQGIFGISFRKRGCDPEPSSVSRLSFPTVNLAWQWHTAQEGEVYLRTPTASCMSSMELKSNTERERQRERKGKPSPWKQNRGTYWVTLPQSLLVDPTELQWLHSWGHLLRFRNFLDACNKLRIKLTNYVTDTSELFNLFYSKQSWQHWQASSFFLLFVLPQLLGEKSP